MSVSRGKNLKTLSPLRSSSLARLRGGRRIGVAAFVMTAIGSGGTTTVARTARLARANDTLTYPPTLQNLSHTPGIAEFNLTAAPARVELVPGKPTAAYAYNGSVPGPTIELHEGDSVIIHFRNELPEPTTVHWHGMHIPSRADGSPLYPIPPGGTQDYAFRLGYEIAGTYWYHPHPDRTTTRQVAKGLYGALIVRAAHDPLEGIPEKLLILSDNRFNSDGSVDLSDSTSLAAQIDGENGREGNTLLVNGRSMPSITIRHGEAQRWRIVNAGAARVYRLAIPGQKLIMVGSDGGLLEKPRQVDDILLANSERVEVLIHGTGAAGAAESQTVFQTLPYDRYDPHTRPSDWNQPRDLLSIQYSSDSATAPVTIPTTLRTIPAIDTSHVAAHRVFVLSQGLINGKTMDMSRVDVRARLGTTEIWEIQNVVGMDHPFHLHGFHFQVLDRDGVQEPYRSWKDSVNIPKHGKVRIIVRFDDYGGKWMFHCHILDHEDMGMMGILELR